MKGNTPLKIEEIRFTARVPIPYFNANIAVLARKLDYHCYSHSCSFGWSC